MNDYLIKNADQYDILIVDDTPDSLELLGRILEESGYRVRPVPSGRIALKSIEARLPDLILLDVKMPEIDGYEMCRRLKVDKRSRNVPIIFISAYGEITNKVEGFKAGGVDYIDKPFEREEVLARVNFQLRLHELTERLEEQVEQRTRQLQQEIKERKRTEEKLRQSKERYQSIFDNAVEGIFQATPGAKGRYISANPAHARILGYDSPEQLLAEVSEIGPQIWINMEDRKLFSEEVAKGPVSGYEIQVRRRDGALVWVSLNARPVFDGSGELAYIEGMMLDITDRKEEESRLQLHRQQLEELVNERTSELRAAKEQAEAANTAKSDFLARMSHELRTPLNAILGYTQIFLHHQLDDNLEKGMSTIQQSGEHLLTLINDILDTATIEAGKVILTPESVHLDTFLQTIIRAIRSRDESRGLSVTVEKHSSLPGWVIVDATRLRQVLLNLLHNAVKFTERGSVILRVACLETIQSTQVEQQPVETRLRFEVVDTGIGIAPDELPRIFTPFEQAANTVLQTEGTGLGLFISSQLVALMGGELEVASEVDHGSTFTFEIVVPVAQDPTEQVVAKEQMIIGYNGPRLKVLVVDDIASNRSILVDMLTPIGFDVVEATDSREAVTAVQKNQPDIILMDRYIPELDGLTAIHYLRRIHKIRKIPAIAISANVSERDRSKILKMGFNGFLSRPVRWNRLATQLQNHLNLTWKSVEENGYFGENDFDIQNLTPPPIKELKNLLNLVNLGDMEAIATQAVYIESLGDQYRPFAKRLRRLAEGFEDGQIHLLVEQCMEMTK